MDGVDTNDLLLEPDRDAEAAVSAKRLRYTWAQLPAHTPRPSPRCSHSATAVPGGLLIYGGGVATPGGKFTHCGDAWLLDEETARWRELEMDDSCARRGHTSVYDARREQLVVFGGVASYDATVGGDGDDVFVADASKLRIYDVGAHSLSLDATPASGEAPGPRRAHVAYAVDDAMVIYGGYTWRVGGADGVSPDDVCAVILEQSTPHVLDLATRTWSRLASGAPDASRGVRAWRRPARFGDMQWRAAFRGVALAACAAARGAAFVVGGVSAALGLAGGVHALSVDRAAAAGAAVGDARGGFEGTAWTPRFGCGAACLDDRFVVVFGGTVAGELDGELDAGQRESGRPVPCSSGGGVFGEAYFDDCYVLRLLDAPEGAERRPVASLASLAERRLASTSTRVDVAHLLAFAHDRGCAGLKRSCLEFRQRSYNPLFQDAGGDSAAPAPASGDAAALETRSGYGAARDAVLARELRRALDGMPMYF
ncbi:hypothetical protein SO694_00017452 [Aureococcus anophagefferens]|uniref:Uncharacterized protein n=1 Tax=Aureococcus anophagefferens TaxID=44056 RepID=A0ABR1G1L7_AURAN